MFLKALTFLLLCTTIGATMLTLHYQDKLTKLHRQHTKSISQVKKLALFSKELRIASYPTACDKQSQKILGADCDLGNYMEWAGPHLEHETKHLLETLTASSIKD